MNPEIWALLVDVTKYWDSETVKHTGRIFDVYIYDSTVRWHLCSFNSTYECHFIWSTMENNWNELPHEVRRAIDDGEAYQKPVDYYSCYDVDAAEVIEPTELPSGRLGKRRIERWDWDEMEDYDEDLMDFVVQAVRENGL